MTERKSTRKSKKAAAKAGRAKIKTVMREYKRGTLKGGKGRHPKVKSRKQAVAIALSEARKSGARLPRRR
jgi:hypothetical protein